MESLHCCQSIAIPLSEQELYRQLLHDPWALWVRIDFCFELHGEVFSSF